MTMVMPAIFGALLGGTIWHFGGALIGGVTGWLCGRVYGLGQELDVLRLELERLRERRNERGFHAGQPTVPVPPPSAKPDSEPAPMELTEQDLVFEPEEQPVVTPPIRKPGKPFMAAQPADRTRKEPVDPAPTSPLAERLGTLCSGENLLVKLGVIILFFGAAFLVKYAAQHGLFPLELRLAGAAMGGCALLSAGWRLKEKRPVYAQVIQGGGIGILYLTTFAAMRLYHLIPATAGFVFLAAICALAGILAVLQDAAPLAVLGSAGGFLAPELAGLGSGSHVMLFSYYAVLNTGIVGIARYRSWRTLNLLGFICTFIVGALWGGRFYQPLHFVSVEPFLVLFFLMYTGVAISFTRQQSSMGKDFLDGTLVFGTPIVCFALQAALVQRFEFGLAWSAFALGCFYLALTAVLLRRGRGEPHTLCEAFLAFGAIFTTLAIPLAFDGRWTAAAWCVEGAGLVWVGLRQYRQSARGFGYLLLIGAGVAFLADFPQPPARLAVLNGQYLGTLLVCGAALFSALLLQRNRDRLESWENGFELLLFAWGLIWWYGGGLYEIEGHVRPDLIFGLSLTFIAISCGACRMLRPRLDWVLLDIPSLALLPVMVFSAGYLLLNGAPHPAAGGGSIGWPVAFMVWYAILRTRDTGEYSFDSLPHAVPFWLFVVLCSWEICWQVRFLLPEMAPWALMTWGAVPAAVSLQIIRRGERLPWLVSGHYSAYLWLGCGPVMVGIWLWTVFVNLTEAGNPWPLAYLPIVNPLDVTSLLVFFTLISWYLKLPDAVPHLAREIPHRELRFAFGGTIFLWLNGVLLRSLHHCGGVAYTADALFNSMLVQTALSIFWSLSALVIMTFATRRGLRHFWLAGAALLAVVVGKLFLVDLAGHGSVERIVSFVAVGILLLLIGWFAPVPPRLGEGRGA